MKKVIIFFPHIREYGGIERNIIALAIEIKNHNKIPVLLCYYDHIDMRQQSEEILEVEILGDSRNPYIKGDRLRSWILKNKSQISGFPIFFGAKAGFYGALGRLKNIFALHYTDPPSLLEKPTQTIVQKAMSFLRALGADRITQKGIDIAAECLTMTSWNARELEGLYGRPFKVVHQGGVPPEQLKISAVKCQGNTLRFFSICRLASTKNLYWILDLAYMLKTSGAYSSLDKIEIVIAGKGPERERLFEKAAEMGVSEIVSFPGFLDSAQLEAEYEAADIFLVPGRQGYGLPVLEALYRNLPVVLNRESRISEILDQNAWVSISDNSSESFIEATIKLIKNLRKEMPNQDILASLPTEQKWALEIGKQCKWWS